MAKFDSRDVDTGDKKHYPKTKETSGRLAEAFITVGTIAVAGVTVICKGLDFFGSKKH